VLAIREMVLDEDFGSDSEVEESGRLKEKDLAEVYRWCVSEDQRADILTKKSPQYLRAEWLTQNCYISIRSAKRSDELLKKAIPSRPRPKLDRSLAKMVLDDKDERARAAGFDVAG
jgi:hypothetical protein